MPKGMPPSSTRDTMAQTTQAAAETSIKPMSTSSTNTEPLLSQASEKVTLKIQVDSSRSDDQQKVLLIQKAGDLQAELDNSNALLKVQIMTAPVLHFRVMH